MLPGSGLLQVTEGGYALQCSGHASTSTTGSSSSGGSGKCDSVTYPRSDPVVIMLVEGPSLNSISVLAFAAAFLPLRCSFGASSCVFVLCARADTARDRVLLGRQKMWVKDT